MFSIFYINSYSLNKSFLELENLLQSTNIQFDVIAITETAILKNLSIIKNIELSYNFFEYGPTEYSAGGTILYAATLLSNKKQWLEYLEKNLNKNLFLLK